MSEPVDDGTVGLGSPRRRTARASATVVGLVLAAFLVVLVVAQGDGSDSAESPLLGQPAPVVRSTTIDGPDFDLARRKGSWVVLNFFNSTCVPCIEEHPLLVEWAGRERQRPDGAEIYTIVNDDSDDAVRSFFAANGGDWSKVRDDDGAIAVAFGVAKVPETWVVDPAGFVRLRIIGALTEGFLDAKMAEMRGETTGTTP